MSNCFVGERLFEGEGLLLSASCRRRSRPPGVLFNAASGERGGHCGSFADPTLVNNVYHGGNWDNEGLTKRHYMRLSKPREADLKNGM